MHKDRPDFDAVTTLPSDSSNNDSVPIEGTILDSSIIEDTGIDADTHDCQSVLDSDCSWKRVFGEFGSYALRAIWTSAPDDLYVVGDRGTLLHYNGSDWRKVDTYTTSDLLDIWGSGKDDVYVVGGYYRGMIDEQAIALHFDGSGWDEIERYLVGFQGALFHLEASH
ncbi:MAG: hypothetical protein JXA30_06450 [Deltaproteobacteria bacterium]|nr:hypothetical protein [Deltaproteobacteria bacterium]